MFTKMFVDIYVTGLVQKILNAISLEIYFFCEISSSSTDNMLLCVTYIHLQLLLFVLCVFLYVCLCVYCTSSMFTNGKVKNISVTIILDIYSLFYGYILLLVHQPNTKQNMNMVLKISYEYYT